jgi:hypothetical protein
LIHGPYPGGVNESSFGIGIAWPSRVRARLQLGTFIRVRAFRKRRPWCRTLGSFYLFPENRCARPQLAPQDVAPASAGQSAVAPLSAPPNSPVTPSGCHVHDWHRLASIDKGPCSGELLHTCSFCAAHPLVHIGVAAQEQVDPMVCILHSCTLACAWPFNDRLPSRAPNGTCSVWQACWVVLLSRAQ